MYSIEIGGIFPPEATRLRSHGTTPSERPARQARDRGQALLEQSGIASEFVDNKAVDACTLVLFQNEMRAGKAGDNPRVDIPSITTGTLAAVANPILAMSPARRLISPGCRRPRPG